MAKKFNRKIKYSEEMRFNPLNRERAFCFQFEDDVKMLHAVAMTGSKNFKSALQTLKIHISAYESLRLQKEKGQK